MLQVTQPIKVDKAWGYELWIRNDEKYCGKILHFNPNSKFSFHFHLKKTETWFVSDGEFYLSHKNLETGTTQALYLKPGDVIHIKPGEPHQLKTIGGGEIIEVSTEHFDEDSYRIEPGDSQNEKEKI